MGGSGENEWQRMNKKEAVGRISFTSETSILNAHPSPNLFQAHYLQYTVLGFLVKINKIKEIILKGIYFPVL